MRKSCLRFLILLLIVKFGVMEGQNGSELDIQTLTKNLEARFQACPRREVVAEFRRKRNKYVWEKQAWGPPADVFADVKENDSIVYPYVITVEFSLVYTYGPERQNKTEAESDTNLSQLPIPLVAARRGEYRDIYLAGKDGIRLRAREFLHEDLDGTRGSWEERPLWPDACWDQIQNW